MAKYGRRRRRGYKKRGGAKKSYKRSRRMRGGSKRRMRKSKSMAGQLRTLAKKVAKIQRLSTESVKIHTGGNRYCDITTEDFTPYTGGAAWTSEITPNVNTRQGMPRVANQYMFVQWLTNLDWFGGTGMWNKDWFDKAEVEFKKLKYRFEFCNYWLPPRNSTDFKDLRANPVKQDTMMKLTILRLKTACNDFGLWDQDTGMVDTDRLEHISLNDMNTYVPFWVPNVYSQYDVAYNPKYFDQVYSKSFSLGYGYGVDSNSVATTLENNTEVNDPYKSKHRIFNVDLDWKKRFKNKLHPDRAFFSDWQKSMKASDHYIAVVTVNNYNTQNKPCNYVPDDSTAGGAYAPGTLTNSAVSGFTAAAETYDRMLWRADLKTTMSVPEADAPLV